VGWGLSWTLTWALGLLLSLSLSLAAPRPAAAQGTWLQTQCLAGAGTRTPCKAAPAWGRTGTDYVQALATAAGPGNLGLSLVKPETLPAANAARAQLAAVMLGYLDSRRPQVAYRWYGPVATAATGPRAAGAGAAVSIQGTWLGGALGDDPLALSASWWLAPSFFGSTLPAPVDANADRYRVLRFLADHCPQLEGKVAPNAWTRCTR